MMAGQWFPFHGIFGSWDVAWHTFATSFLGIDSSLFTNGRPAVADYDYGFAAGTKNPINLQGTYKVLRVRQPADQPTLGGDVLLQTPNTDSQGNHGQLVLEHLSAIASDIVPGMTVGGGKLVGYTGWPSARQYSIGPPGPNNAHLAVIVDATANDYLRGLAPNGESANAATFPAPVGSSSSGAGGPFGFISDAIATLGKALVSYGLVVGGMLVVSVLILRQFNRGPAAPVGA